MYVGTYQRTILLIADPEMVVIWVLNNFKWANAACLLDAVTLFAVDHMVNLIFAQTHLQRCNCFTSVFFLVFFSF